MVWNFRNVEIWKKKCLWIEEMDSNDGDGDNDGNDDDDSDDDFWGAGDQ